MSLYLESLVAISALVGVCSYVSYGDKYGKTLKFAASAILLCAVVSPFAEFVKEIDFSLSQIQDSTEISFEESELSDKSEQAFCNGIRRYVCDGFSLDEGDVYVTVSGFDAITMKAQSVNIVLYGSAVFADNRAIAESIFSAGLGECEVQIGVK